jgi:branched-chain amino acid transport system ATP-binding protein
MKAIEVIHSEHRALAAVLQGLRFVVGGIRDGRFEPDFRLLSAMIDYITQVPEKVHHPKEDKYLFARLRERSPKAAELIALLEREHQEGYHLTGALALALIHYQGTGAAAFAIFDEQVQQYLDFNWQHLKREESELTPLAQEVLSDTDWAAIDAEFASNANPCAGAKGEYTALFRRIVNLTPTPYGLGPS